MTESPRPTEDQPALPITAEHGVVHHRLDVMVWQAEALLAGRQVAIIVYKGQEYRLRLTGNDKLFLTK